MSYYECKRCLFISKQRIGMTRHLNRRNKCIKNIVSYKFSDQELYNLSLISIHKPIDIEDSSLKDETLCTRCNKRFSTKGNLMKHLKKNCVNIDEHPYYNIKKEDLNSKIQQAPGGECGPNIDNYSYDDIQQAPKGIHLDSDTETLGVFHKLHHHLILNVN